MLSDLETHLETDIDINKYNHPLRSLYRHSLQIRFEFRCLSIGSPQSQTRFLPDWHRSLVMIEMQSLKWSKHDLRKKNKDGQNSNGFFFQN